MMTVADVGHFHIHFRLPREGLEALVQPWADSQSEIGRRAAVPCFQESSKLYLNFKIISQPKLHLQSKGRLKCYDTKLYLKTMPVLCFCFLIGG